MTSIEVNKTNNTQSESKSKQPKVSLYWKHTKVLFVYTLMIATAVMYVLWHSEQKARDMERETYQKQIQELKDQNGKMQSSLLNQGQQQ